MEWERKNREAISARRRERDGTSKRNDRPISLTEAKCTKCLKIKAASDFGVTESKRTGKRYLRSICKPCNSIETTERWNELKETQPIVAWSKQAFRSARLRANERGLVFTLSVDMVLALGERKQCEYCQQGVMFNVDAEHLHERKSATLDRVIGSVGYVPSNVVLSCWRCNVIKNDATADELIQLGLAVKKLAERSTTAADQPKVDGPTI